MLIKPNSIPDVLGPSPAILLPILGGDFRLCQAVKDKAIRKRRFEDAGVTRLVFAVWRAGAGGCSRLATPIRCPSEASKKTPKSAPVRGGNVRFFLLFGDGRGEITDCFCDEDRWIPFGTCGRWFLRLQKDVKSLIVKQLCGSGFRPLKQWWALNPTPTVHGTAIYIYICLH